MGGTLAANPNPSDAAQRIAAAALAPNEVWAVGNFYIDATSWRGLIGRGMRNEE